MECNTKYKGEKMSYNNLDEQNNVATISGTVSKLPEISHQIEGETFLDFEVEVERLSKTKDIIPVTISERALNGLQLKIGEKVLLNGQYRSHNKSVNDRNKLILHFFAKDITTNYENEEQINEVKLIGYICKAPIYRKTPFDREICDVLLAVNRSNYHRTDYIPCILWGRNARFIANQPVGTKLEVVGRIQSRVYYKTLEDGNVEERTAYEVSGNKIAILENNMVKLNSNDEKGEAKII